MKKKLVGIVVFGLLIATVLPAVGTMTEKEIPASFGMSGNSLNYQNIHHTIIGGDRGGLFIQLPIDPTADWFGPISDLQLEALCYDDFWNVTSLICDIHWWGFGAVWDGSAWVPCDLTGSTFNITFYEDDGSGNPGAVVCSYVDVTPSVTPLGIHYETDAGTLLELSYFEVVDLDPCCDLSDGWVSVLKTHSPNGCTFGFIDSYDGNLKSYQQDLATGSYWTFAFDLAFILTDGEPAIPVLECDGEIRQTEVPPGANVTGDFVVRNNGDADSVLQWRIENTSLPNWGSNWTITPSADFQTPDMGWLIVIVNVTAPDEKNKEFTGTIKVVNAVDPSEYCEIDVYIKTPRSRAVYNTLFLRLFECFPNAFVILRQLLGLH